MIDIRGAGFTVVAATGGATPVPAEARGPPALRRRGSALASGRRRLTVIQGRVWDRVLGSFRELVGGEVALQEGSGRRQP